MGHSQAERTPLCRAYNFKPIAKGRFIKTNRGIELWWLMITTTATITITSFPSINYYRSWTMLSNQIKKSCTYVLMGLPLDLYFFSPLVLGVVKCFAWISLSYILLPFIRLGVSHDGGSPSCPNYQYVMAGTVPGGKMAGKWTPCSKLKIQTLLR